MNTREAALATLLQNGYVPVSAPQAPPPPCDSQPAASALRSELVRMRLTDGPPPSARPKRTIARQQVPQSQRDWALCTEVGLFLKVATLEKSITCVACGQDESSDDSADIHFRSLFWIATTCHVGHVHAMRKVHACFSQVTSLGDDCDDSDNDDEDDDDYDGDDNDDDVTMASGEHPGLCSRCDKDFVLDVVLGKRTCGRVGCRRVLCVHEEAISELLKDLRQGLLREFLALAKQHDIYNCAIHADEVRYTEADTLPSDGSMSWTPNCSHDLGACAPCMKILCEGAIEENRLGDLLCPEPSCRQRLPRRTIRQVVSRPILRLYDKKLALAAVANNPSFRWCRCGHGVIHDLGETQPEWICQHCNLRHCFICEDDDRNVQNSSRGTIACEHLRAIDRENQAHQRSLAQQAVQELAIEARENTAGTKTLIANTSKRCPRYGCRIPIHRDGGCGHMTCRNCRTEFCWSCKVIWMMGAPPGDDGTAIPDPKVLTPLHLTTCGLALNTTIERSALQTIGYAHMWDVDEGFDTSLDEGLWIVGSHQ